MPKPKPPPDPFLEAVLFQANAQIAAAQSRFRPADPSLEKPRDASNAFVRDFAAALSNEVGPAKLIASRREVQIKRGDLTFCYAFQASSNNTAGVAVGLWPHAYVHSHALRLWRRDKVWARTFGRSITHALSRPDDGLFVGGMLGNFFNPRRYIALEIANPANRPGILKQMTQDCSAIDARLLVDLASKESFFAYAAREETDLECLGDVACEYVAAHWGKNAVRDYAAAVFATRSDARSEFGDELARLSADPEYGASRLTRLHGMAQFFFAHDLQSP